MLRLALLSVLVCIIGGCGDAMSRGIIITGDGKMGANNARNQRENAQDRLRNAIEDDLGAGWGVRVVIDELPVWTEERFSDDGSWRWERITAAVTISPPAGQELSEAKRAELVTGSTEYLLAKLVKKDPAKLSFSLDVGAAASVQPATAPPVVQSPGQRTYVVQPGDTLADISTAFYGSPQHWRLIAEANPAGTQAGQTIVIPAQPAPAAPPAP